VSSADDPTIVPLRSRSDGESTGRDAEHSLVGAVASDALPPGATVGRYVVLEELGAGAMGRVYSAFDPRLDRRVALKLMRGHALLDAAPTRASQQLLREAQALARLAHPNVVAVHDVAIVGGAVAIAMEFVRGDSLREWMDTPRRWPEIVAVFIAAGRGLAAAHAAGVIHRDFKPDNVMLGEDGRARVVDFGLARSDLPSSDSGSGSLPGADVIDVSASATAGMAGTPAYMAPELFAGGPADGRSDQFSFCVALFEALHGQRPFIGGSLPELAANVARGRIITPSKDADVPAWLLRVVTKGLQPRADDRHADMNVLVVALQDDPGVRRRRMLLAGAGVLALVGISTAVVLTTRRPGPCESADDALAEVWNDDVRARIRAALDATGVAWAEQVGGEIDERLAAQAEAWRTMAHDSCVATRVRGEQSEQLLDLRAGCLDARRRELVSVTHVLAEADAEVAREAVRVLEALGPVDACADIAALQQAVPPPDDPEVRARVDQLRASLTDVDALGRAGKYDDALARVLPVVEEAAVLDYAPLVAEAGYAHGYLQDKLGESAAAEHTLAEAGLLAARHRHDAIAARALADTVFVIGAQLGRTDEGLIWARHAEAAADRTGDPLAQAKLLNIRGLVLSTAGRFAEAEQDLLRALEIRERELGVEHLDVSGSLSNLAGVLEAQGRDLEAVATYQRAYEIDLRLVGPDHPRVGAVLTNSSKVLLEVGRTEEALSSARRAEAIFRATLPPGHPNLAAAVGNVASALWMKNDFAGALAAATEQLHIDEQRLGRDHPELATPHHNLGVIADDSGDPVTARAHFERSVELYEARFGPDHPEIAGPLNSLGALAAKGGDFARARDLHLRAIAILDHAKLTDRIELALALRSLGRELQQLGDPAGAMAAYQRALEMFSRRPDWANRKAETRLLIAQLRDAQGDRKAALALARTALAECPADDADELRRIREQLAAWGQPAAAVQRPPAR
jgi:eukaryotic-like serine/threonine-protein kinase